MRTFELARGAGREALSFDGRKRARRIAYTRGQPRRFGRGGLQREREKKECKRAPTRPKIISKTRKNHEGEAELTFSAKGNFRLYKILNFGCLFSRAVRFEKSY